VTLEKEAYSALNYAEVPVTLERRSSLPHEASSVEYVVFDWPNIVYYVPIPQGDHGTVASLEIMEPWPV